MAAVHPGIADPRIMAKLAASIDRISGGRFCINIVNGTRPQEHNMYGRWIESDGGRYRQMQEFIQVMKGLMTQDRFTLEGEFYQMKDVLMPTRPVRAPHPPIFAASRADDGMNVVAAECDTWFVNYDKDIIEFEESEKQIDAERDDLRKKLGMSVNEIELSVRAANCLNNANITSVGELSQKTEAEMLKYRNFGKKSLNEIKAKLSELGLSLGMKFEDDLLAKPQSGVQVELGELPEVVVAAEEQE